MRSTPASSAPGDRLDRGKGRVRLGGDVAGFDPWRDACRSDEARLWTERRSGTPLSTARGRISPCRSTRKSAAARGGGSPRSPRSSSAPSRWAPLRSSSGLRMSARSPARSGASRSPCRCSMPGCGLRTRPEASAPAVLESGDPVGTRFRRRPVLLASGDPPHERRQRDLLRDLRADLGGRCSAGCCFGERVERQPAPRARSMPRRRRGFARPQFSAQAAPARSAISTASRPACSSASTSSPFRRRAGRPPRRGSPSRRRS